jgi:hypothetical protein
MLFRQTAPLVFLITTFVGCSGGGNSNHERPSASYDPQTGKLERLVFDSNDDGRNDAAGVLDGARVKQIELDSNGNGTIDRWDFYDAAGKITRVGLARADDGVMDAVAVYGTDHRLQRLEVSTRRDGRFDRVEFYEAEQLTRAEEDTDADGLVDKWESYRPNVGAGPGEPPVVLSTVAFDDNKRGRPSRRLVYALGGQVARVEHDTRGDGTFGNADATDATRR